MTLTTSRVSTILFLLILSINILAQTTTRKPSTLSGQKTSVKVKEGLLVTITHVYQKGAGLYDIDIKVRKGKLRVGEEVDVVDTKGNRFRLKIVNLRTPYNDVKELEESEATNYALLQGPSDAKFDADFVIVAKDATNESAPKASNAKFIGKINDKAWKGGDSFGAFSFLKKGSKILGIQKPVMQLAFKSMDAVDDRQLTIWIFTSDAQPGTYSNEKIEVLLSGSPTGDTKNPELWGFKFPANKGLDISITISSYEEISSSKAVLTGSIRGKLVKPLSGKGGLTIEGEFKELSVDIYNTNQ